MCGSLLNVPSPNGLVNSYLNYSNDHPAVFLTYPLALSLFVVIRVITALEIKSDMLIARRATLEQELRNKMWIA